MIAIFVFVLCSVLTILYSNGGGNRRNPNRFRKIRNCWKDEISDLKEAFGKMALEIRDQYALLEQVHAQSHTGRQEGCRDDCPKS